MTIFGVGAMMAEEAEQVCRRFPLAQLEGTLGYQATNAAFRNSKIALVLEASMHDGGQIQTVMRVDKYPWKVIAQFHWKQEPLTIPLKS